MNFQSNIGNIWTMMGGDEQQQQQQQQTPRPQEQQITPPSSLNDLDDSFLHVADDNNEVEVEDRLLMSLSSQQQQQQQQQHQLKKKNESSRNDDDKKIESSRNDNEAETTETETTEEQHLFNSNPTFAVNDQKYILRDNENPSTSTTSSRFTTATTATNNNDYVVDKILSQKLNELSLEERTEGMHELHGVADHTNIKETHDMVQSKLLEMNNHIISTVLDRSGKSNTTISSSSSSSTTPTPTTPTTAYQIAVQQDQGYVNYIQLLCLRATNYDIQKSTKRLLDFFACKLELFDSTLLTKTITLENLKSYQNTDQDDTIFGLENGCFTLLQQRDTAGRAIIMFLGKIACECTVKTSLRILYYNTMAALRDQEIQRNGIVIVLYSVGQTKFYSDRPSSLARVLSCLPVRLSAVHMCHDRKLLDVGKNLLCQRMENTLLCRFRAHYGTYIEVSYHLMTFGIPKHVLPINEANGEFDLTLHRRWLQMEQAREQQQQQIQQLSENNEASAASAVKAKADVAMSNNNDNNGNKRDGSSIDENYSFNLRAVTPPPLPSSSSGDDYGMVVVVPGPMDIILGRGSSSISSPGYVRMKTLIQDYYSQYESAGRNQKVEITKQILTELNERHGCRFVRWTEQGLVLCDETDSRDKISHAFRNMRRRTTTKSSSSSGKETTNMNKNKKQQHEDPAEYYGGMKRGRF